MNKSHEPNRAIHPVNRVGVNPPLAPRPHSPPDVVALPETPIKQPTIVDARITSLKVLVITLLNEIESLQNQIDIDDISPLNLQEEVHRFEAALIRVALLKTGGRQRRAARLLGTKVTTFNTKIKRYGIDIREIEPQISQINTDQNTKK
jgi:DNA-binding protein Fis